jgi:hypothetical protein
MNTQQQVPPPVFDPVRFKQLYKKFNQETIDKLPDIYSPQVVFKDPVHQLQGIHELSNYFAGFCSDDLQCEFTIYNEIISHNQAFFQWKMDYQHPRLESGKPLTLDGSSLIKFNSHITFHQDFYDMGAMIYQHVPVLGWVVRKVNAKIAQQAKVNPKNEQGR